jgi:hypothetical protein
VLHILIRSEFHLQLPLNIIYKFLLYHTHFTVHHTYLYIVMLYIILLTEFSYIFRYTKCEALQNMRTPFIDLINNNNYNFKHLDIREQFIWLMSNEDNFTRHTNTCKYTIL